MMERAKRNRRKQYPEPKITLEELKLAVLQAAGIQTLWHRGFSELAALIYDRTGKRISVTTLKRVYGFAHRKHKLSGYTLAVLVEFSQAEQLKKTG